MSSPADLVTLDGMLTAAALSAPTQPALIVPRPGMGEQLVTFAELEARVSEVAAGLADAGLRPGMRAALLVPPTADFFVLSFALLRLRVVPVLIDPGIGRRHLATCLAEAAPHAFIGVTKAHLARKLLRWCPDTQLVVTAGSGPRSGLRLSSLERRGRQLSPVTHVALPAETLAAIVFTSGSTGIPKGVEHTHRSLLAQTQAVAELYELGPHQVSLATFPPFALFGPPLGMTTVIPRMNPTRPAKARPTTIITTANRHAVTTIFASPALLDTLTRGAGARRMPSVKQVISAGAPVHPGIQRATVALLGPGAQVHSPYGATEALPVTSIASDEVLSLRRPGICVGRAVAGIEIALISITDDPISTFDDRLRVPLGEVGEVLVRGPMVTEAYFGRRAATVSAKLDWDGLIAHRMGDLASLDDQGRLWFAGRKAHVVWTPTGPLFSVPVEEVFNSHPQVRRSALVGLGERGAQRPVLCVELEPGVRSSARIREELINLGSADPAAAQIAEVVFHRGFPVDIRHNAKIDRPALARWVQSR